MSVEVLGKASCLCFCLLASTVETTPLEQPTPHSNPLLNRRSGVLLFFFLQFYKSIRFLFSTSILPDHHHLGQGRALHRKKKKKSRSFAEGLLGGFSRAQISTGM